MGKSRKKSTGLNIEKWEALAIDRKIWRTEMCEVLLAEEQYITLAAEEKREEGRGKRHSLSAITTVVSVNHE